VTSIHDRLTELATLKVEAVGDINEVATERQHAKGKLTARERIDLLLDKGTFTEIEPLRRHRSIGFGLENNRPYTDGVVAGWGTVDGRTVFVYAHDFRIFGGALGEAHAQKIHKIMDLAAAAGRPLVSLNDGAGARIQEGVSALAGYGGIFQRNTRSSGCIPQISVMLGPCAGGAAYSPALTDFIFVVRGVSRMFITGPDVIRAVTGEEVTQDGLGGADVHSGVSGVAHYVYDDEETCLAEVRFLLSMLPSNNRELAPIEPTEDPDDRPGDALLELVPANGNQSYDIRSVIEEIVDDGQLMEVHAGWAPNLVCAFARLGGEVVGVVANQPAVMAGVLDIKASEKGARFVQFCDAFNVPLITLVDVPGFLPGVDQEHEGIIRRGAKLLYAYCNATVPRISVAAMLMLPFHPPSLPFQRTPDFSKTSRLAADVLLESLTKTSHPLRSTSSASDSDPPDCGCGALQSSFFGALSATPLIPAVWPRAIMASRSSGNGNFVSPAARMVLRITVSIAS